MSDNNEIKTNSWRAWYLAARPKTLTGAATPVIIGIALALKTVGTDSFQAVPALLCLLFAWLMQIESNFINDYFDYIHGNDDTATRLGPKRACAEGWITLPAMRLGIIVISILAAIAGIPLIWYGGWQMIIVGAACLLFAFLYTTFFSYHGMGDMLVLIFFGIVPVCLTYYVIVPGEEQSIPFDVLVISIACGLIIDTLLCINNYRDRDNDRRDGKKTLVVRLGTRYGGVLYLATGLTGSIITLCVLLNMALGLGTVSIAIINTVLCLVYLFLHIKTFQSMIRIGHGRELNKVLGLTARNIFIYGIITFFNIILLGIA